MELRARSVLHQDGAGIENHPLVVPTQLVGSWVQDVARGKQRSAENILALAKGL